MSSDPTSSQPRTSGNEPAAILTPPQLRTATSKRQRFCFGTLLTVVLVLIVLNVLVRLESEEVKVPADYGPAEIPAEPSFKGGSDQLKQTVVVPTLESPLAPDTSAIWCGTLAMAWQQAEKKVVKKPLVVLGEEETSRDLRKTPWPDLEPKDYYVAAGFYKDGIQERIRRELAARFPKAPLPEIESSPMKSFMAYAYLEVALRYEFQFQRNDEPFLFKDSRGNKTKVRAFGIREQDAKHGVDTYRAQVQVLFKEGGEFALDLSKRTRPYQIVLARMEPKPTLQAALAHLDNKIAAAKGQSQLGEASVLLAPSMNWQIDHRFRNLEGKDLRHPPEHYLSKASQFIHFKMDRKGAEVSSAALINADWCGGFDGPNPYYIFDRPFLLLMKKRGSSQPFLVMWVANAELLEPF